MRLIDADALTTAVLKNAFDYAFVFGNADMHRLLVQVIAHQPTIDAEPVPHGKWIRDEFGSKCGHCGLYAYRDKFDEPWESPYCPNCGARMDEEEESK